jgi:WD40 repeat protein
MIVWKAHRVKIRSLVFSPDGRFIATTAGSSKFVWLWEATTGKLVRKLSHDYSLTRHAAFHPDGRHVIGLFDSHGGCVWDLETGQTVSVLETPNWQYSDTMAVSPADGRVIFHVSTGLSEWTDTARPSANPRRDGRIRGIPNRVLYYPLRLAYSPSGRFFCLLEGRVTLVDAVTHQVRHEFIDSDGANASAIAFSADESRVAVAFGHRAAIWRMEEPRHKPVVLRGHFLLVRAVGFLPGGETVLTAGMDGMARLWDATTGTQLRAFDWGIGKLRVAAVAADGLMCAAGGEKGQIVVWDVEQ